MAASLEGDWGRYNLSQSPKSQVRVDVRETCELCTLRKGNISEKISGIEGVLMFGLALVLPAAQGGKRTCRSGETGEEIFTSFLFATILIFFCLTVSQYPVGDVLKI
jgi:hypothetical protein